MRLINTTTFEFKEFYRPEDAQYAIISHRWGDDELTYQSFLHGRFEKPQESIDQAWGWTKIVQGCRIAKKADLSWLWIDTVCINKDSSAELSEAINSMYKWYHAAQVCYVFLQDVRSLLHEREIDLERRYMGKFDRLSLSYEPSVPTPYTEEDFVSSEWHKRGWTLQELLAPKSVHFFNQHFEWIGCKKELVRLVSLATGIPEKCITEGLKYGDPCIAERMKWAAKRKTSREECGSKDMAYCLMGVFDVNMPLLYGEGGEKAFVRLQRELIQKTSDESLFAWNADESGDHDDWWGLLAPSPDRFLQVRHTRGEYAKSVYRSASAFRRPFSMTSQGLRLDISIEHDDTMDDALSRVYLGNRIHFEFILPLNCYLRASTQQDEPEQEERLALRVIACPVLGIGITILRAYRRSVISYREAIEGPPRYNKDKGALYTAKLFLAECRGHVTQQWDVYFPQKGR